MRVTAPVIGRLVARPRLWAFVQVRKGRFGLPRRRGRALEVELANVERELGLKFTSAQLIAAGAPIVIETTEVA